MQLQSPRLPVMGDGGEHFVDGFSVSRCDSGLVDQRYIDHGMIRHYFFLYEDNSFFGFKRRVVSTLFNVVHIYIHHYVLVPIRSGRTLRLENLNHHSFYRKQELSQRIIFTLRNSWRQARLGKDMNPL